MSIHQLCANIVNQATATTTTTTSVTPPPPGVRARPVVANGTIKTDTGTLLRGGTMSLNAQTSPVSSNNTYWSNWRAAGLNVSRLDVKTVQGGGRSPTAQLPYLDAAVSRAEANHMYLIIMQSVAAGSYNKTASLDFWNLVAPRYKDRTCVIYEMINEPTNGGPYWGAASSFTATVQRDLRDIFNAMRNGAPNTPILAFSSANLYPNAAAYITMVNNWASLSGPAVDWTKTLYSYHHYLGTYNFGGTDGFGGINTLKASFPLIMTECNDFMGDPPSNDPRNKTAVWLEYEQNGVSWICLDGKDGSINTQITNEILPFLASHGFPVPKE